MNTRSLTVEIFNDTFHVKCYDANNLVHTWGDCSVVGISVIIEMWITLGCPEDVIAKAIEYL